MEELFLVFIVSMKLHSQRKKFEGVWIRKKSMRLDAASASITDLQMELRPCRMTPVKRVGCSASTSSHWFLSLY